MTMNTDKNSFTTYLNEIGKTKQLTDEQENQLAQRIAQGDAKAIDELTSANLTYVVSLASQYKGRGLDLDDLVSEGNMGMLKAATRFKADKKKRFVTFAAPYIREAIEQAIEQQAGLYRVPRDVMDAAREKRISRPLSMDAPVGGSVELSLARVIADKDAPDPEEVLNRQLLDSALRPLLGQLTARERQVLQRFYGLGVEHKTLAEIGQEMGLKRERVRQIRDKAVRHICRITDNAQLKAYLNK